MKTTHSLPRRHGLYDPQYEHDSCGVGFVAHIKGERSHQIILDADEILINMDHRGARGCESNTGDGAGFLTALPHEFLKKVATGDLGVTLPEPGRFAAGLVFLPTKADEREHCKTTIAGIIAEQGQQLLGWRRVPTDADAADLGPSARAAEPAIEQLFIAAADDLEGDAFERHVYMIRKRASHTLRLSDMEQALMFYICSLSTKVIVYKGMLAPEQEVPYYPDLADPDYTSHLAMVHSRFSTNTFPSWDRAQPNRFMSHNGEINTLRGNKNWMRAREGIAESELFGDDLQKLFPVVEPECSDSGTFDNVLEFLLMNGRTLQAAVMMMIPEAWENHESMSPEKKAFYEYHSCMMEPWDGPASIAFTDGRYIGAVLDRNGLRPSRYYVTRDDRVIMASEVGVLKVAPENVRSKGRLRETAQTGHTSHVAVIAIEYSTLVNHNEAVARQWGAAWRGVRKRCARAAGNDRIEGRFLGAQPAHLILNLAGQAQFRPRRTHPRAGTIVGLRVQSRRSPNQGNLGLALDRAQLLDKARQRFQTKLRQRGQPLVGFKREPVFFEGQCLDALFLEALLHAQQGVAERNNNFKPAGLLASLRFVTAVRVEHGASGANEQIAAASRKARQVPDIRGRGNEKNLLALLRQQVKEAAW
jgi:glutamate synthase domain-containing protein 1